jgi:hypothetical protein
MTSWYRNPILAFIIGWSVSAATLFALWLIAVGSIEAPINSTKNGEINR